MANHVIEQPMLLESVFALGLLNKLLIYEPLLSLIDNLVQGLDSEHMGECLSKIRAPQTVMTILIVNRNKSPNLVVHCL